MLKSQQIQMAIVLAACLVGILLFSLVAHHSLAAPLGRIIGSATLTRTSPVTPMPTPLTQAWQRQLSFGGLGGGGNPDDPGVGHVYYGCQIDPPAGTKFPAIIPIKRFEDEFGGLCLYGFPEDEDLTLKFTSPDGRSNVTGVFRKGDYDTDFEVSILDQIKPSIGSFAGGVMGSTNGGAQFTGIVLWMPIGLAEGGWEVEAHTSRLAAKTKFPVRWSEQTPRLHIVQPQAGILSRPADYEPITGLNCTVVKANDKVKIVIANFPANTTIPVGVYQKTKPTKSGYDSNLMYQTALQTDWSGNYHGDWSFNPKLTGGRYFLVSVLHPELDFFVPDNPTVCVIVTWQACPKTLPSRLSAGLWGMVLKEPPVANRVRATASRSGQVIGYIQPGEDFKILSGPQCSDGWVWWYIQSLSGVKGWTAEGNEKTYWLSP